MQTLKTFWTKLALWTAAIVFVLVAFNLLQWLIAPRSLMSWTRYAMGTVEHLPFAFGMLLPLVAYAAGVAAATEQPRDASTGSALLSAASVSIVVLLLVGFFAPWLERAMTYDSAGAVYHRDTGQMDLFALGAAWMEQMRILADDRVSPYEVLRWRSANNFGWQFNARIAMSVMPLLTTPIGFLVGRRAPARRGSWTLAEAWAIGLLLFLVVSAFVVLGNEVTEQRNVSPLTTAWLPLFGPAVALLTLWWAGRHAPAAPTR